MHQKLAGLIPSQGTHLDCSLILGRVCTGGNQWMFPSDIDAPLSLSLHLPLSQINKHNLG